MEPRLLIQVIFVELLFESDVGISNLIRRNVESDIPAGLESQKIRRRPRKMKYLLLIYQNEKEWAAHSQTEVEKIYQEYGQLREELVASRQFIGGSQLQPIATASSVQVRDGKELITDGPFAETHEQLGGYFLVEAKNLDEALAIAARIPSAREGTVEVRPIVERAAEATA